MTSVIVKYIYGIFQVIGYVLVCYFFMSVFLNKKKDEGIKKVLILLLNACMQYIIDICFANNILLKIILVALITIILSQLLFSATLKNIFIFEFIFQALSMLSDFVVFVGVRSAIPAISDEMMIESTISSLLGILSLLFIFVVTLLLRRKHAITDEKELSEIEWLRFMLFPLFTLIIILALILNFDTVHGQSQGVVFVGIATGLLLFNVAFFSLLNDAITREQELARYKIAQANVKNQIASYDLLSEKYKVQRKQIHEFKNHITCIQGLAYRTKYDDLKNYLEEVNEGLSEQIELFNTNNEIVNTILNAKYQTAVNNGISFIVTVCDMSLFPVSKDDTVILLANMLDNAIEACAKCNRKYINLRLVRETESTILSVRNSYSSDVVIENKHYITTKSNPENHGIGIDNIISVVEKYNGDYSIRTGEEFRFVIEIPDNNPIVKE